MFSHVTEMEKMRKDPSIHFRVNIGLPHLKPSRRDEYRQRTATLHELRSDSSKVRSVEEISLDDVRCEWLRTSGPFHMKTLAEHFNIYDDLFGEAYFVPRVPLTIKYEDADGVQTAVYSGNQIKPVEVRNVIWTRVVSFFWLRRHVAGGQCTNGQLRRRPVIHVVVGVD